MYIIFYKKLYSFHSIPLIYLQKNRRFYILATLLFKLFVNSDNINIATGRPVYGWPVVYFKGISLEY